MIPLLDILQSIPVLSFLPGVMLAMAALFPGRQLGVELGAVLLIFTGQVWNMAFSFYASLKSIPREMREAATIYRFNWWQRFVQIELPFATIGLVWNSMMSVAGAWFFLMACEQFGDFRLPGLGSYLQAAADDGDTRSILLGILTMVAVIVLIDQFVWRPVIAWAEKFKMEQVESADAPTSWVLDFLRRSRGVALFRKRAVKPLREHDGRITSPASKMLAPNPLAKTQRFCGLGASLGIAALGMIAYAMVRVIMILIGLHGSDFHQIGVGLLATWLRVNLTLLLGALWTIPVGVAIGFNPRLARIAQPLAQIAASVPATAVFPVVLLVLIRLGGGLGLGSIVLLLARHAVVHLVQCDRRRHGNSHRLERSGQRFRHHWLGAMAQTNPSRNFPVSCDGNDHGIRRRMERQHRRRILPPQGSGLCNGRHRRDDFRRHRCQEFQSAVGQHDRFGRGRGHDQPPGLASALSPRRDTFQTRRLTAELPTWLLKSCLFTNH